MFYFTLKIIKEDVIRKLRDELGDSSKIYIRGDKIDKVKLPSELSGILLPVNLIASKQCPTHRDIFLKKVKQVPPPLTWASYQGKIIHGLYFKIFKSVKRYIIRENILPKIDLLKYINKIGLRLINELTQDINQKINKMVDKPCNSEKRSFFENLRKLVRMESEIVSTLIDYSISSGFDIHLDSEFQRIFPFQCEISLNATPIGFSKGVKPDFVYSRGDFLIIGDIKTGPPKESDKLALAAYSLAYEYEERIPVNFGVILNVNFSNKRNVPIYQQTETFVISDKYRQAFLKLRDERFDIVKNKMDPGLPRDEDACKQCPYFKCCRGS